MTEQAPPSIVDQVADLFVFGPIGLLVDRSVVLPDLAARGRSAVRNQITMARFIGEFAVRQGERKLSRWADQQRAAMAAEKATSGGERTAGTEAVAATAAAHAGPAPEPAEQHIPVAQAAPASTLPAPAVGDLALADYDTLAATQVIGRLEGLSAAERDAIGRYEAAHRGRRTILGKIAQLG